MRQPESKRATNRIRNLFDVPGLETLTVLSQQYRIRLLLIGSVCRRLLMMELEHYSTGTPLDLFDLVPAASDIDLIHSGPSELTPVLLERIAAIVPSASCFRWQLRSYEENLPYWDSLRVSPIVPPDLLSLASDSTSGLHDRWDARHDFATKSFRYIENGFYYTSPLAQSGKDVEFFTALSYLRAVLDAFNAAASVDRYFFPWNAVLEQPGLAGIRNVCKRSMTLRVVRTLNESAPLRASFWYRLVKLRWSAPTLAELSQLLKISGLYGLFRYLGETDSRLAELISRGVGNDTPNGTLLSPALGGDLFRLPKNVDLWFVGHSADTLFRDYLQDTDEPRERAMFASSPISISAGLDATSEAKSEFIHFEIPQVDAAIQLQHAVEDYALGIGLIYDDGSPVSSDALGTPAAFSVPALFYYRSSPNQTSLVVRANCFRVLAEAHKLRVEEDDDRSTMVRLFVLVSAGKGEDGN